MRLRRKYGAVLPGGCAGGVVVGRVGVRVSVDFVRHPVMELGGVIR